MPRSTFGTVRRLPSGRWQARFQRGGKNAKAPATFPDRKTAEAWLDQLYAEQPPLHPGCPTCTCAYTT